MRDLSSHFVRCIFGLLLFLTLTVAPLGLKAQEAVPQTPVTAPTTAQSAAPEAAAKPDAAKSEKSEKEESDAFLLDGPIVKWTAQTFNLSRATAAAIFLWSNFAILALGIGIPLFKFLPKFLRKRTEKLRNDIESARKVTEDANTRLSAVEAQLAGLGAEIASFRSEVEAESQQDEARIKSTIAEESARIVAAAEQEVTQAANQAKRGLRHFAADLAIEQAAKQLVLTPENDKALIAEFIGDVSKGGLN